MRLEASTLEGNSTFWKLRRHSQRLYKRRLPSGKSESEKAKRRTNNVKKWSLEIPIRYISSSAPLLGPESLDIASTCATHGKIPLASLCILECLLLCSKLQFQLGTTPPHTREYFSKTLKCSCTVSVPTETSSTYPSTECLFMSPSTTFTIL
jgi:hypothetical protein